MPNPNIDTRPALSVLDRLINDESSSGTTTIAALANSIKLSLRRDLEWLLNTRQIPERPPESLKNLNNSLYLYGIPDLSTFSISSKKEKTRLVRVLQDAVRLFEPRLGNIRVIPIDALGTGKSTLFFRIDAMLRVPPLLEHVSFDTVLELSNGDYTIKGGPDAG